MPCGGTIMHWKTIAQLMFCRTPKNKKALQKIFASSLPKLLGFAEIVSHFCANLFETPYNESGVQTHLQPSSA